MGIIIPVLPSLIQELTGSSLSVASTYSGWLLFSYAGMQFLFSPIIGGLSDRYGRRPVLLLSLLGFGIDYAVMGFAPSIMWLFIGRLFSGLFGASFTTGGAYIADVSPPEKRAQNFGLIGAAFGLGFIIGPVAGGMLSHYGGMRMPFFAASALALINAAYGYFVLPESLPVENRRKFSWKRANPVGSLFTFKKYPVVFGLLSALFCIWVAGQATQSTWIYYTMHKFRWTDLDNGYSLGFVGFMSLIVQVGLIRIVVPKLGKKWSIYTGLMLYGIGFLCFAFASQSWMMYAGIIPFCMGGICGPTLQGVMSGQVPPDAQGELQGGLTSLMSLSSIIGPLLMTNLFAYFTSGKTIIFPGASFLTGAVLTVFSVGFAMRTLKKYGA